MVFFCRNNTQRLTPRPQAPMAPKVFTARWNAKSDPLGYCGTARKSEGCLKITRGKSREKKKKQKTHQPCCCLSKKCCWVSRQNNMKPHFHALNDTRDPLPFDTNLLEARARLHLGFSIYDTCEVGLVSLRLGTPSF